MIPAHAPHRLNSPKKPFPFNSFHRILGPPDPVRDATRDGDKLMDWYYVDNGQQAGPVSEADFQQLISAGKITPDTLVWNQGMAEWTAYRQVASSAPTASTLPEAAFTAASSPAAGTGGLTLQKRPEAAASATISEGGVICAECGNPTLQTDAIQYGSVWVCSSCKPAFVQKLKEGVARGPGVAGSVRHAGFWIRFLAKFVDNIITTVVTLPVGFVLGASVGSANAEPQAMLVAQALSTVISIAVAGAYTIFFVGRYAATPGKMVCRLQVITADGGQVSYARATGRYFAEMLSGCPTIMIGYIIAAFDDQKRALHDHICTTRVVYKD